MKRILLLIFVTFIFSVPIVSADYQRNIDDEIKIYQIKEKLYSIYKNQTLEKQDNLKDRIESLIGDALLKMNIDVSDPNSLYPDKYGSFQEYLYLTIYRDFKYGVIKPNMIPKIIENDFVTALVYESRNLGATHNSIVVTKNAVYNYQFGTFEQMVQFDYVPKGWHLKSFIMNKYVGKEYEGKCRLVHEGERGNRLGKYRVVAYGEYKESLETPEAIEQALWMGACGKYGQTNGVRYFEMLSDTVLMFTEPGQGGIPIDLETIVPKQNVVPKTDMGSKDLGRIPHIIKEFGNGFRVEKEGKWGFLYHNGSLIDREILIGDSSGIIQIEKGASGTYLLQNNLQNGLSIYMFDTSGGNKRMLHSSKHKNIEKFELLTGKRIKLLYQNGTEKIINIDSVK